MLIGKRNSLVIVARSWKTRCLFCFYCRWFHYYTTGSNEFPAKTAFCERHRFWLVVNRLHVYLVFHCYFCNIFLWKTRTFLLQSIQTSKLQKREGVLGFRLSAVKLDVNGIGQRCAFDVSLKKLNIMNARFMRVRSQCKARAIFKWLT